MTGVLSVADISGYLAASGWVRRPGTWRGASVWVHGDEHEILVPARDGMGDGPRRVREIVAALAAVEGRSRAAVAADVAAPADDVQWYRAAGGTGGLTAALTALESAKDVLGAAARAVVTGPRAVFEGPPPRPVRDLLDTVGVAPFEPGGDRVALRLPLGDGPDPLGRRALVLLRGAALRLSAAADAGDLAGFDASVGSGASANLCRALARFAGPDGTGPFEVGFRWARALPRDTPQESVAFGPGAGRLLGRAGFRLRRLRFAGEASVTGLVDALRDDGGGRFRVHVRGTVTPDVARALWVRLPDAATYDRAIAAHREQRAVTASGGLTVEHGHTELVTGPGEFRVRADP